MVLLWMMMGLSALAAGPDTLSVDTVGTKNDMGLIRRTVREFDRLNNDYIEPQHYEFTVMGQITRTFESFILSSNGQQIKLAPDGLTKIGPYFGWRWFFLGYTFDIKNIGFSQSGLRKEFDLSIYSSQVGIDIFYRRTGNDYKIRDVRLGYGVNGDLQILVRGFAHTKISHLVRDTRKDFNDGRVSEEVLALVHEFLVHRIGTDGIVVHHRFEGGQQARAED